MAEVEKQITVVFDNDAPLPSARRRALADGIFLATMPPLVLDRANENRVAYLRPNFASFARRHCHPTTLNLCYVGNPDLSEDGIVEEESRSRLNHYLHAMTIHRPGPFAPHGMVTSVPSLGRVCNVKRIHDFGGIYEDEAKELTPSDFRRINTIYAGLRAVIADRCPNRVSIASGMYHNALRIDIGLESRFVGLMTGLEALVSTSDTEITHQLAERTAFLLRSRGEERLEMYRVAKRLYRVRSQIVHGDTSPRGQRKLRKSLPEDFGQLLEVVRSILVLVLLDDSMRTFFQSASAERLDEGMKYLIFHGELNFDDID